MGRDEKEMREGEIGWERNRRMGWDGKGMRGFEKNERMGRKEKGMREWEGMGWEEVRKECDDGKRWE